MSFLDQPEQKLHISADHSVSLKLSEDAWSSGPGHRATGDARQDNRQTDFVSSMDAIPNGGQSTFVSSMDAIPNGGQSTNGRSRDNAFDWYQGANQ